MILITGGKRMNNASWQVGYPKGLMKYIDFFRKKYFQYEIFDVVLHEYFKKNVRSTGNRICSLGSGTGRHEVELAKLGYEVIGLERNDESVSIANEYIKACNSNVKIIKCDFLIKEDVDNVMNELGYFDIVALLLIPISIDDYSTAANNMAEWIKPGGLFVTDNFGYSVEIDTSRLVIASNVEVANDPNGDGYAVRMNYYEYKNNIVNWDAVYLYHDDENKLCMKRDHDILDVIPEQEGVDPLNLDKDVFEMLPNYRVTECEEGLNPPYLYEYLIGWRKK
jgi:SAM-dependent methyltransferase